MLILYFSRFTLSLLKIYYGMTVVCIKEFETNQAKYFDMAEFECNGTWSFQLHPPLFRSQGLFVRQIRRLKFREHSDIKKRGLLKTRLLIFDFPEG